VLSKSAGWNSGIPDSGHGPRNPNEQAGADQGNQEADPPLTSAGNKNANQHATKQSAKGTKEEVAAHSIAGSVHQLASKPTTDQPDDNPAGNSCRLQNDGRKW
jgi:hypothetical protein